MRTEKEIKAEIRRIEEYKQKCGCSEIIGRECDLMIQMLTWVLESEPTDTPS